MDAVGKYILSVTAAAILCGILRSLLPGKGTAAAVLRLAGFAFLVLTMLTPVKEINMSELQDYLDWNSEEGTAFAQEGTDLSRDAMGTIIKSRTEAYILDKAEAMELSLSVEVSVSDDDIPVPQAVRITGSLSPYAKAVLSSMLEEDLGITKENQTWNGQN